MTDPKPPDPTAELERLRHQNRELLRRQALARHARGAADTRSWVRRHPVITTALAAGALLFSGGLNQADRFADWTARQLGARGWRTEPDPRTLREREQDAVTAIQDNVVTRFEERTRLAEGQPATQGYVLPQPRAIRGLTERLEELGAPPGHAMADLPSAVGGASDFTRAIASSTDIDRAHIVAHNARGLGSGSARISIASVMGTDRRGTMVLDLSRIPGALEGQVDIVLSGERGEASLTSAARSGHLGRGQYAVPDTGDAGRLTIYRRGDRSQPLFQLDLDRTRADFYEGVQAASRRQAVAPGLAPSLG
jgi:hypothetical protein